MGPEDSAPQEFPPTGPTSISIIEASGTATTNKQGSINPTNNLNTNNETGTQTIRMQARKNKHTVDNKLHIFYTNADALPNKMIELRTRICTAQKAPDIIAITEVKPKNSRFTLSPPEYVIEGYEAFFPGKDENTHRGIIIWVKNNLDCNPACIDSPFCESVWLDLKVGGSLHLLIGCVYRSPNSTNENTAALLSLVRGLPQRKYTHLLMMGDFNYPGIDWSSYSTNNADAQEFLDSCQDSYLYQHILLPTRGRLGHNPSLLDLIFTNEEEMVENIELESPLGKSDHACIVFDFRIEANKKDIIRTFFMYDRADYNSMRLNLASGDWVQNLDQISDIDDMYNTFLDQYNSACTTYIPRRNAKQNLRRAPGVTSAEVKIIRRKNRAWTRYMETRSQEKYKEYTRLRNKVKSIVRGATARHEKNILSQVKENPKAFWKYANSKTKVKEKIPDLIVNQNTKSLTRSDAEKAKVLLDFFSSVFTDENIDNIPRPGARTFDSALTTVDFDEHDVMEHLTALKPNKSTGPDGVHPRVLRETASVLCKPLTTIFKASLAQGKVPSIWKMATITAIHKKGSKQSPDNYRPVSLTCIPCKVMESVVRKALMEHMDGNSLLTNEQFGFRERRSTSLQLLATVEDWMTAIDAGLYVDACFLDLQKAFDSVPHQRLLRKLESFGIQGNLYAWIASFLIQRYQMVKVNGTTSEPALVKSGVPQGSVLGPVLFILYINDMVEVTKSNLKLYADDAKLYRPIVCDQDRQILQEDICQLEDWSTSWMLRFHPSKCKVIRLRAPHPDNYNYTLGTSVLGWSVAEKDLGIIMDFQLRFREEISQRVKKANSITGVIRRTFHYLDPPTFSRLFSTLVRPHLDYAASVWNPHLKGDIEKIEKVQRRATKQVPMLKHQSYAERLKTLQLTTLRYRRHRGDMIETYKILTNKYDVDPTIFFSLSNNTRTRGHCLKLEKTRTSSARLAHWFSHRVVNYWNSLPEHIVTAPSLNTFKNRLDKYWSDHPLKYNYEIDN